jgi:Bacterial extracellular solute-binding proteins, family 3
MARGVMQNIMSDPKWLNGTFIFPALASIIYSIAKHAVILFGGHWAYEHFDRLFVWIFVASIVVGIFFYRRRIFNFLDWRYVPKEKRWDEMGPIRFGCINYPQFSMRGQGDVGEGWAVKLLSDQLFKTNPQGVSVVDSKIAVRWENAAALLDKRRIDIVATPIFETRKRLKLFEFSAPIFFSNIGLYVHKENFRKHFDSKLLNYSQFVKHDAVREFTALAYDEEISENLGRSYFGRRVKLRKTQSTMANMFTEICQLQPGTDNTYPALAVFCETYEASQIADVSSGDVVNILTERQFVFPIGFAMRRKAYQLRNFVNLRLMEFLKTENAIDDFVKFEAARRKVTVADTEIEVKRHFIDAL